MKIADLLQETLTAGAIATAVGLAACAQQDPSFQAFNATRTFANGVAYIASPDDTPMEHANRQPEPPPVFGGTLVGDAVYAPLDGSR